MNANYIYDIFATCEDMDLPDLTIALAHHKEAHPIPCLLYTSRPQ